MNKQFLWFSLVLLIVYLVLVFCDESDDNSVNVAKEEKFVTQSTELFDEARYRKRYKLFSHFFGWHALAIAYWIKVKVVIVAFFLGSAIFLGLRHFWPHTCKSEISHGGPIIYDAPYHHHDHIPYALEHSDHIEHSFGPYSSHAGAYSESGPSSIEISGPPVGHSVKRRGVTQKSRQKPVMSTEEQIAELMFSFLGLDSKACRRRFICEMEFRSKLNPISAMAFRIVGRGFFEKYTNARNIRGRATSFFECANVNPDCVFIEQTNENENTAEDAGNVTDELTSNGVGNLKVLKDSNNQNDETSVGDTRYDIEAENETNLAAEKLHANRRRRKNRSLKIIRERFLIENT